MLTEATAAAAASSSKQVATHFALAAQAKLGAATPTAEALSAEARALLGSADIPEEDLDAAIGEMCVVLRRSPDARAHSPTPAT
jgi:hypothetical protein